MFGCPHDKLTIHYLLFDYHIFDILLRWQFLRSFGNGLMNLGVPGGEAVFEIGDEVYSAIHANLLTKFIFEIV